MELCAFDKPDEDKPAREAVHESPDELDRETEAEDEADELLH